jgi:methionyl-tRNA formyltransferase
MRSWGIEERRIGGTTVNSSDWWDQTFRAVCQNRRAMRIVFLGTPEFTLPLLEACARAGELVAVIAQPNRPVGRHAVVTQPPSKIWAEQRGIPVLQPEKLKQGRLAELLAEQRPDVAVVAAYGRILPADALRVPRHGCINVHASLLPELRGAAPAQWALARQYCQTGVTILQMDEGLDTGEILLQKALPIAPDETGESLLAKLAPLGAEALLEALPRLEQLPRISQDHSRATLAPLLTREDGRADFRKSAFELDARRRGFTPWPGAWTTLNGQTLKIHSAEPIHRAHGRAPGEVLSDLDVACGEDTVWRLREVQLEGKKRLPAGPFLAGLRLDAGFRLGT